MANDRRMTNIVGRIGAVATVFLILTVAVHDVSMAASGHVRQSPGAAVAEHPAGSNHHQFIPVHDQPTGSVTLAPCDPPPCPDFVDCSVVRVSNPITTASADLEMTASDQGRIMTGRDPVVCTAGSDRSPPPSAGVRRALLQVFLN